MLIGTACHILKGCLCLFSPLSLSAFPKVCEVSYRAWERFLGLHFNVLTLLSSDGSITATGDFWLFYSDNTPFSAPERKILGHSVLLYATFSLFYLGGKKKPLNLPVLGFQTWHLSEYFPASLQLTEISFCVSRREY